MRILILCHAFNSLSQRIHAELIADGHEVSVELDIGDEVTRDAVARFRPDVLVAPFLKRKIPDDVWQALPCLIVHPGPPGDRGPNALDWAVFEAHEEWGVSIIRANDELDGGPVLAHRRFPLRATRKSSLYRFEVTEAALASLREALQRLDATPPEPVPGRWRGVLPKQDRRVDWTVDDSTTALRKIRSADGQPGAVGELAGRTLRLFDARLELELRGAPGSLLARCQGAVCVATRDGALWVGRLKAEGEGQFKRRAVDVLGDTAATLPELPGAAFEEPARGPIRYRELGPVGVLEFDFYNGAMSTPDCEALLLVWEQSRAQAARVVVLAGGDDFWSNGMDLNAIEAAESAADESWANINAIDDLVRAIVLDTDRITVSALGANAAAGGVFLALAADRVWARSGVVLNPHYKNMGNLYGSEYWTYLLPRRVGADGIDAVMGRRLPMLAGEAERLGLVDAVGPNDRIAFRDWTIARAAELAGDGLDQRLAAKRERRRRDEAERPLESYRGAELERIRMNFYGFDPSYHVARYRLVQRTPHAWTPLYLARHRRVRTAAGG